MKTFKENRSKLSGLGKVQAIISLILVPCVVILSLLEILNALPLEFSLIVLPILGGVSSLSGILYKKNRALRIVLIGCIVLIFLVVIVKLMH